MGRIITVDGVNTTTIDNTTKAEVVSASLSMRAFVYAIAPGTITAATVVTAAAAGTNTVTETPAGAVPTAVTDPTNVDSTSITKAFTG